MADWVIVTVHNHEGGATENEPSDHIREFAHAVIDAGADVFTGHGPHQDRGIEIYNGKPIFYSLGNFAFEQPGRYGFMAPDSVIARLTFGDRPACDLVPLLLDEHGIPGYEDGDAAAGVIEKVRDLSRDYGAEIEARAGFASVVLG